MTAYFVASMGASLVVALVAVILFKAQSFAVVHVALAAPIVAANGLVAIVLRMHAAPYGFETLVLLFVHAIVLASGVIALVVLVRQKSFRLFD